MYGAPANSPVNLPANATRILPQVGTPDPNFKLSDLEGNPAFISDLRGNVVLLNFWATWCGPCRVKMTAMKFLYQDLHREDFETLAFSNDPQVSPGLDLLRMRLG